MTTPPNFVHLLNALLNCLEDESVKACQTSERARVCCLGFRLFELRALGLGFRGSNSCHE